MLRQMKKTVIEIIIPVYSTNLDPEIVTKCRVSGIFKLGQGYNRAVFARWFAYLTICDRLNYVSVYRLTPAMLFVIAEID